MSAWGDTLTEQLAHDILMDQQHPVGTVLDTARAGRAPSRSSGSGLPSSASPPGETAEKRHHVDYSLASSTTSFATATRFRLT